MRKKLYLVTGFLGAGKTTLMHALLRHFADQAVAVIVNEFGEKGIDGALLARDGVRVEEISDGSIFCVCRSDLFADALIKALQSRAGIVLVETSGLSDPTGIGTILATVEQVSGEAYDFAGTIAMVDAPRFHKVVGSAVAVRQQVLSAGLLLINKTDLAPPEDVRALRETLAALNPAAALHETQFARLEPAWLEELAAAQREVRGGIVRHTLGVSKALFDIPPGTPEAALLGWLRGFCGESYRAKGFVSLDSGWKLIDAVGDDIRITDAKRGAPPQVVLLAGSAAVIQMARESYENISRR
ncbi:MAG: hypothetical protein FWF60_05360 [Oscillospiraceae bacterium]|nr:hypothetical protein [Oscillospiraceae bacterium]